MTLPAIWSLLRTTLAAAGPVCAAFAADLPSAPGARPAPAPAPGLSRLAPAGLTELALSASKATRPLALAVARDAGVLGWRSSYSIADAGAFAEHYAWAPMAGPDGPLLCPAGLVSVMHVGPGQGYPAHRHAPEEVYLVLAGTAEFTSGDRAPQRLGPGGLCHHAPQEVHALRTHDSAVLVLSVWRGAYEKSEILRMTA